MVIIVFQFLVRYLQQQKNNHYSNFPRQYIDSVRSISAYIILSLLGARQIESLLITDMAIPFNQGEVITVSFNWQFLENNSSYPRPCSKGTECTETKENLLEI